MRGIRALNASELLGVAMANGWTPERRARQAELIRTWRPWDQSTGPRTAEGKSKAAGNAERFYGWTAELKAERQTVRELRAAFNDLLREQRVLLRRLTLDE